MPAAVLSPLLVTSLVIPRGFSAALRAVITRTIAVVSFAVSALRTVTMSLRCQKYPLTVSRQVVPNNSFKPKPLRGSA
jgi:hypothetical protein